METAAWQRLRAADAALSPHTRSELLAARKAISEASHPVLVNAHEPVLAHPRNAYRQHVVTSVLETLVGAALEYAEAFDEAVSLLELAASDVFGQLAVYRPVVLHGITNLAAHGPVRGTLEFSVEGNAQLGDGSIAWLDDPLCPDAVHLIGLRFSFDQVTGMRFQATAQELLGTAAVWPRPHP